MQGIYLKLFIIKKCVWFKNQFFFSTSQETGFRYIIIFVVQLEVYANLVSRSVGIKISLSNLQFLDKVLKSTNSPVSQVSMDKFVGKC